MESAVRVACTLGSCIHIGQARIMLSIEVVACRGWGRMAGSGLPGLDL